MSSFRLCSDEDLEAIFYHLDFPTKCKFRRCSRPWNHLLRSANVLHTVVFTVSPDRLRFPAKPLVVLQSALPHMVSLAWIFSSTYYGAMDHDTGNALWDMLRDMPANQQQARRLHVCNFDGRNHFLRALYDLAAYDWIEVRNWTLSGDWVSDALLDAFDNHDSSDEEDDCFPLEQSDPTGLAGLTVNLTGSYLLKSPSGVIGLDETGRKHVMTKSYYAVLFGWIKDNMSHLTQQETTDMLERLRGYDEDSVQVAFLWLLKVYEPDLMLSTELSCWTFDYRLCSPLVGRLLACYDGTGENDMWVETVNEETEDESDEEDGENEDGYTDAVMGLPNVEYMPHLPI